MNAVRVDIIYGQNENIMEWHMSHTGQKGKPDCYAAIGIGIDGNIVGSVVYSRFRLPDIEMHVHTTDKRWCCKRVLRAIFDYPFNQLGCGRVTVHTSDSADKAVLKKLERVGFVREGLLRKADPLSDSDIILLGMLREDCKWV